MSGIALIVYGSLMHPDIGREMSADAPHPVWVQGFRRGYFQAPMWRRSALPGRFGVLSVRADQTARMNAVLWTGVEPSALEQLDVRERGYVRCPLAIERVTPFASGDANRAARRAANSEGMPRSPASYGVTRADIYVGRDELFEPALRPLPEYVAHCRTAAAAFGAAFLEAFEATTRSA